MKTDKDAEAKDKVIPIQPSSAKLGITLENVW